MRPFHEVDKMSKFRSESIFSQGGAAALFIRRALGWEDALYTG